MAASLSGGICSLVHRGSCFSKVNCFWLSSLWLTFFHYLLGPRRHLSVRASSDTVFLPASTLSSVLPPFLALLSQELPPWACPPVSPVQILCGSPLSSSWGGAPRLCCSVDFTTDEGERTGKLSPDWDSVGTSQPAGYRAWLWVLWHVGLALHPLLCPWTPWRWTWLKPEVRDREVFFFFFKLLLENCGASS